MDYNSKKTSYKYAELLLWFVVILAFFATSLQPFFIKLSAKNEKKLTIPVEEDIKPYQAQKKSPQVQPQPRVQQMTSNQSFIQAQQSIKKVQKQMAREDGYFSDSNSPYVKSSMPKYIENTEKFETIPPARVLDSPPGEIIIEPAD